MPATVLAPPAIPRAVEAVVEMPGMPAVSSAIPVMVDPWVETTLLRATTLLVSPDIFVLAPPAIPRAVEDVVEMPGMSAVRSAIPVMVDTCVDTTLLSSTRLLVSPDTFVLAVSAIPSAVEAVVEMPGISTVRSAMPVMVDT